MHKDPIQRLLEEHADLLRRLEPFRRAVREYPASAGATRDAHLANLREGVHVLTTDLHAHSLREDDVFFPAVERAIGGSFGPTNVMRSEHRSIRAGAGEFAVTLRELQDVQHPAIVSGGAQLREMVATGAAADELCALGTRVMELIDDHFAKEEQILFPMSRNLLDAETLAAVARDIEALDYA